MYSIIDTAFPDHRKVRWLERLLSEQKATVVGRLVMLWGWALSNAEDGFVAEQDAWLLEDAAGWAGDTGVLIDALVKVRFLEPSTTGYILHDWSNHGGRVIKARDNARERMRANRAKAKKGKHSENVRRTFATNVGTNEIGTNQPAQEAACIEEAASVQEEATPEQRRAARAFLTEAQRLDVDRKYEALMSQEQGGK